MAGQPSHHRADDWRRRVDGTYRTTLSRRANRRKGFAERVGAARDRLADRLDVPKLERRCRRGLYELALGRRQAAMSSDEGKAEGY